MLTVLLASADRATSERLQAALVADGCEVVIARSGRASLERASAARPDVARDVLLTDTAGAGRNSCCSSRQHRAPPAFDAEQNMI